MNAYKTSLKSRATAAFLACITSALVLGATVAGFQPADPADALVVLERVTVRAAAVN
jgi:hypothetical protein